MSRVLIRGGTIVHPDRNITEVGDLWIEGGQIAPQGGTPTSVIDASGLYVAPGFIDLQVNGGIGHNFEDSTPEEVREIVDFHVSHGTIGLLPTVITAPIEKMQTTIGCVKQANHPTILGMHLEGPFISMARRGAHNPKHIIDPCIDCFDNLVRDYEGFIKIVTLAPERPGAEQLIARIREIGAVASLGHSDATYEEAITAIKHGVGLFTHSFNAMSEFHHRAPGAVGAALVSNAMVELIADGIHVHPGAMRLLRRAKGSERICLITDAISATGLEDGEYHLGGLTVFAVDATARLADGTLAGSVLTMNRAVKTFMNSTGCALPEAVRAASLSPARLLGIDDRKGSIAPGRDADLVILDEGLNVYYTIIKGDIVYARDR